MFTGSADRAETWGDRVFGYGMLAVFALLMLGAAGGMVCWVAGAGPFRAPEVPAGTVSRTAEIGDLAVRSEAARVVKARGIDFDILRVDYTWLGYDRVFVARMAAPGGSQVFASVTPAEIAASALPRAKAEGLVPAGAANPGFRLYQNNGRYGDGTVHMVFRWDEAAPPAPPAP